jgi:rare lipoprotein A
MRVGRAIALGLIFAVSLAATAQAGDSKGFSGEAAYYSDDYKGLTASGARYDPSKFTCAHRTLPFGTRLRVTDARTHRTVVVTVTDRGPFNAGGGEGSPHGGTRADQGHGGRRALRMASAPGFA